MAEFIEREAAIREFDTYGSRYVYGLRTSRAIQSRLRMIPAADVRPVVLCQDCDMFECHEYDGGLKYVCRLFKRQMQETDFCSYGEKREAN